jgi:quinoprotein glucose dehydrogenase
LNKASSMDAAQWFLRLVLAAGFISAVGDHFGLWGPPGATNVAWGEWQPFVAYVAKLYWFAPKPVIPALAWTATLGEIVVALGLLIGWQLRWVALASGLLPLSFAVTMTTALGIKARAAGKAAFEATPILVGGTLYLSTPFSRVIGLDPETGKARWVYDPKVDPSINYSEVTSRGVSTWLDKTLKEGAACRRRIYLATLDARLIARDAAIGTRCKAFGEDGHVDLTHDVTLTEPGQYQVTSPPAVIGDLLRVGSAIGDDRGVEVERGVVCAYEACTGKWRWSWGPIPHKGNDPARKTWEGHGAMHTGGANAWSLISADAQRDLIFVPTSSPSPDFYGGEQKGSNLYANSVVALGASTGEVAWHFQVVHHDLWDYDVAAQPMLITITRDGRDMPAVSVGTKKGHIFVLLRKTGKPLFPVEERPGPQSNVPGEEAAPS